MLHLNFHPPFKRSAMLGFSRALLTLLPAAVAGQLDIIGTVISSSAPRRPNSEPGVSEHDAREVDTGAAPLMLRGHGSVASAQADLATWMRSQSAAWVPAGSGRVRQQLREVREEELVDSGGQRLTRRVACVNGQCEGALSSSQSIGGFPGESKDNVFIVTWHLESRTLCSPS